MAYPKVTGSVVSKIIVVILGVAVIFALYIPSQIWIVEEGEQAECRFRMVSLYHAQSQYYVAHEQYADSLSQIMRFAESNPSYVQIVDSLAFIVSREDTSEGNKTNSTLRPYYTVTVTMDSLYRCPTHGTYYNIIPEEDGRFRIECPEVDGSEKLYTLLSLTIFEKSFFNHGWVDQNQSTSW